MNTHLRTNPHYRRRLDALRLKFALARRARRLRRLSITARVALGIVAASATVIGCGWFGPSESVRFSGYGASDARSYERLPPLSMKTDAPKRVDYESDDYKNAFEAEQRRQDELDALWGKAMGRNAVREELEQARKELRAFLQASELERDEDWSQGSLSTQEQRNTAIDLLDALTALDRGTPPESVHAYLTARRAYDEASSDKASPSDKLQTALAAVPRDKNLDDNVAYLRAAALYHGDELQEAAQSFKALSVAYPRSEKREAALFMSALAWLKQSKSYRSGDATALSTDACADCRDEAWTEARTLFRRVVGEYPRGRFNVDARGWLAFSSLRVGDFADALANYYRLLSDESNRRGRAEALRSLSMARAGADEDALRRLEDDLSDEPSVALTYAYHNLYNYTGNLNAYDYTPPEDESGDGSSSSPTYEYSPAREREREKKRERMMQADERKEFQRIGQFAARMLRRYPNAATSADFLLRAAGVHLESDEPREARVLAVRALARGASGNAREDAYWIKGVAEYRLREYDAARRTLSNLASDTSPGRLTKRARILLALLAEDAGDMGGALEQYLWLGYQEDAAYFIDVLMSPEQLAAFIARHPQSAHFDELNYALGVRYLRDGRYAEAREAYARIRTSGDDPAWTFDSKENCNKFDVSYSDDALCVSPKLARYDTAPGVHARWVLRDLKTAETLEWHERAVESAQGDEAKAEALYQMASFLYEGDLLFYNPAAWSGDRYMNLSQLDDARYRRPNEAQTLWNYSQSHDMAARALALYLEVVRRFRDTRAARDALYTAAVCHIRLAGYNPYWRAAYADGLYAGGRVVTFADVRASYPNYQFPRGTYGWQPSTRTVNGEPAWDALPKPRPRLTREARVKLLLAAWQTTLIEHANEWLVWLRHWLTVALIFAAALIAGQVARRTRRQLRVQLARHPQQPRQQEQPAELTESAPHTHAPSPWLTANEASLGWLEQLGRRLKPRAAVVYGRLRRRVEPLLHDAPGRAALASNALSHTVLLVLLYELVRVL